MSDAPLARSAAKHRLNGCLDEGTAIYTKHFREELVNDGFSMEDILFVCRSGTILMEPEQDTKSGHWKYRIEGKTLDMRGAAIVFTLRPQQAVLITVFERK